MVGYGIESRLGGVHRTAAHKRAFHNRTIQGGTQVKHSHNRIIALAVAFVAAVVLALPVTALAGETGQFTASAPQSVSYNGQEHHFKSTVKDKNGKELVEGTDFVRRYYYTDQRSWNPSSETEWKDSDDGMTAAGFVWENIHGIGKYEDYADNSIRHSVWTQYQLKVPNVTMQEGEEKPSLAADLNVLSGNPNNPLNLSDFILSCDDAEKANYAPGEYNITVATDPEKIPAPYTSNSTQTRTGIGSLDYEGYHYYQLVGDDTSGFVQVQVIPGKLTITPAYTQVNVTVAWKDSSNKDGIRPSAEDFAKYLTLTADGEPIDAQAVIVENGDTYNVVFDNVRKYAYNKEGVRHEIAYQVTQANIDGYTTDNATVGNEGTITNTHEIAAAPAEKPSTEKPAAKKTSRKALPQTGDQSANALAVVALGATALGAAVVMKKRNEL